MLDQKSSSSIKQGLIEKLFGAFDFPPEVTQDIPKATMIGRLQLQVENHKGIIEYNPHSIRIRTNIGQLMVTGSRLRIGGIYKQDLVIEGNIKGVSLLD